MLFLLLGEGGLEVELVKLEFLTQEVDLGGDTGAFVVSDEEFGRWRGQRQRSAVILHNHVS